MPDYPQDPRVVTQRQYETYGGITDPTIAQLQLDMSTTIEFIEHDLKGEHLTVEIDQEGNKVPVWKSSGMRMVNDKGVRAIISLLHSYLNVNTFLSVVGEEQIEAIMSRFHLNLAGLLIDNQEEFEISNEYLYILEGKLTDIVWLALLRASKGGKTLECFTKTHSVSEMREMKQERKKFLGLF